MDKAHPHADATYRVVPQMDGTLGVEVWIPGTFPTTVTSFATEAGAEAWIERRKEAVAKGYPRRARFNLRPR
jgi:hypothetical protein